jgi:hypothetical protein
MRRYSETLWEFKTARFRVAWEISPCEDCDLSWDDTGEVADKINSGLWYAFDSAVVVYLDGREVGADYLGQSIYENPRDFRDHLGMNAHGHGSYFSDMVRGAIAEARKNLSGLPRVRVA